jgi:hypothetical protein
MASEPPRDISGDDEIRRPAPPGHLLQLARSFEIWVKGQAALQLRKEREKKTVDSTEYFVHTNFRLPVLIESRAIG